MSEEQSPIMFEEQAEPVTTTVVAGEGNSADAPGDDVDSPWTDMLPEEYRDANWATKYESQEEFFRGVDNMAKLVGKKAEGVTVQGDDATEEDWAKFYSEIGRPETPDKYNITLDGQYKDLFQGGDIEDITALFHQAGLNNAQAQNLTSLYLEWAGGKTNDYAQMIVQERDTAEKTLREEWGNDYEKNVKTAFKGAESAGVLEEIEKMGLGDHPAVIKLAELAGRNIREDSQRDGSAFSKRLSQQEASQELDVITRDANFRNDPAKNKRVEELMEIIGAGKINESGGYSVTIRS